MYEPRPNVAALFLHYARLDRKRTNGGLSVREQQIFDGLRARLNQLLTPGISKEMADRRASIRVPTCLPCTCRLAGGVRDATILDLSRTGMLLQIAAPLALGERVWVGIHTDPKGTELEVPGVVVTERRKTEKPNEWGFGIRLVLDLPELMGAIDDLYRWAIVRAFGSAGSASISAKPGGELPQPAAPSTDVSARRRADGG